MPKSTFIKMFFEMVSEDLGCDLSLLPLVYIRINSTEAHKGQQYKTIGREAISFEFFLHFFLLFVNWSLNFFLHPDFSITIKTISRILEKRKEEEEKKKGKVLLYSQWQSDLH